MDFVSEMRSVQANVVYAIATKTGAASAFSTSRTGALAGYLNSVFRFPQLEDVEMDGCEVTRIHEKPTVRTVTSLGVVRKKMH